MAISKTQPMRPAEIELVDLANNLESGLNDEIEQRIQADKELNQAITTESENRVEGDKILQENIETTKTELQEAIQQEATTRNENDVELQKNIDKEQTARQEAIQLIQDQLDKFEAGAQNDIEVIANANTQITVTFETPKQSKPIVLITLESTEDETNNVNCYAALTDVSETDFHVRIYNLDKENTHTLLVNWLAIGE